MEADLDKYLPAIAAGDPDAFGRWVAGVEQRLRRSLQSYAGQVDAEAVLQEALLRVWQVAPRFVPDGKPDGLARLAVRVARNLAIDELRRRRLSPDEIRALETAATEAARPRPPDPLLRRWIHHCREKLPHKPAAALEQRLDSDGTVPDEVLAERLGMRLNTFLQNIVRARRLLGECLEKRGVHLAEVLG